MVYHDLNDSTPDLYGQNICLTIVVSEQEVYSLIEKTAATLLTPLKFNLMTFSMSLRAHSPAVQMFTQVGLCEYVMIV